MIFEENPLAEFVELPESALGSGGTSSSDSAGGLWYSNILCGVIRGAMEMASAVKDPSHHQVVLILCADSVPSGSILRF